MWELCQCELPQTAAPDFQMEPLLQPLANRCLSSAHLTCAEPWLPSKLGISPRDPPASLCCRILMAVPSSHRRSCFWVSGFQGRLVTCIRGGNQPEIIIEIKQYGVTKKAWQKSMPTIITLSHRHKSRNWDGTHHLTHSICMGIFTHHGTRPPPYVNLPLQFFL